MDIWQWVSAARRELLNEGHSRLVHLMDKLPTWTCDNEHARVDAALPEAIALARAAERPWVEVFVRHWGLQSQVLHRHEAGPRLPEAVSLLEFAHREENRACPQSMCVTQDLANCYDVADGPGYVPERLAVAKETLDRIDPTWACFRCISIEYATALQDDGRHEEALAWIDAQSGRSVAAGRRPLAAGTMRAESMLALGRVDDAWDLMEHYAVEPGFGESRRVEIALMQARVLAVLGRFDEAKARLPDADVILPTPSTYENYVEVVRLLVRGGALENTVQIGIRLREMFQRAKRNGAWFKTAGLAAVAAELAVARGARFVARRALEDAETICREQLRRPQAVLDQLVPVREALQQPDERDWTLPTTADEVREWLPNDAEPALDALQLARERWPDVAELVVLQARALGVCGLGELAEGVLRDAMHPTEPDDAVVIELGRLLLRTGSHDALHELIDQHMVGEIRDMGLWLRAKSREETGELDAAAQALVALLELSPEAINPRYRLAMIEQRRGEHEAALAHLDILVNASDETDYHWDRMTEATIVGDWARVRQSARHLELPIGDDEGDEDDDAPIDRNWGSCRVRIEGEDGQSQDRFARRTGPVTVRVIGFSEVGTPEVHGDVMVIDAASVASEPRAEGDERPPIQTYRAVHRLLAGRRKSFILDGVHPGEEAWDALFDGLESFDPVLFVRSGDAYELEVPGGGADDEVRMGVYATLCVPDTTSERALHERLLELTEGWEHPLAWPDLSRALPAGATRDAAIARSDEITDRYDL